MIEFFVAGIPQSRGSKKSFPIKRANGSIGVAVTDNNPRSKPWMEQITYTAQREMRGLNLFMGSVRLDVQFIMPRPKSHYYGGKRKHIVREDAPIQHISKPDRGKLLRAIEDALTGVVYRDDSQVSSGLVSKVYGEKPGVWIKINANNN